jgi:hypothetical protein
MSIQSLEFNSHYFFTPGELATLQIDERGKSPLYPDSVFSVIKAPNYEFPNGYTPRIVSMEYGVIRIPLGDLELPLNQTVEKSIYVACLLGIQDDGTSNLPELKSYKFLCENVVNTTIVKLTKVLAEEANDLNNEDPWLLEDVKHYVPQFDFHEMYPLADNAFFDLQIDAYGNSPLYPDSLFYVYEVPLNLVIQEGSKEYLVTRIPKEEIDIPLNESVLRAAGILSLLKIQKDGTSTRPGFEAFRYLWKELNPTYATFELTKVLK